MIDCPSTCVVALECVTIWKSTTRLHNADPATSLSGKPVLFIFAVHQLIREGTLNEVEVEAVH